MPHADTAAFTAKMETHYAAVGKVTSNWAEFEHRIQWAIWNIAGPVAELVGIEGGVVSGVINLESSGVEASDWRPRHDEQYYEA